MYLSPTRLLTWTVERAWRRHGAPASTQSTLSLRLERLSASRGNISVCVDENISVISTLRQTNGLDIYNVIETGRIFNDSDDNDDNDSDDDDDIKLRMF